MAYARFTHAPADETGQGQNTLDANEANSRKDRKNQQFWRQQDTDPPHAFAKSEVFHSPDNPLNVAPRGWPGCPNRCLCVFQNAVGKAGICLHRSRRIVEHAHDSAPRTLGFGRHAPSRWRIWMLSRTLSLAAVANRIAWFASSLACSSLAWSSPAAAQAQNLEAGKTPSQIFSSTCSLCHKSSRGMLKGIAPGALPGFLRQHYTTSSDMASAMSAFVISNGAADARLGGEGLTQQGKDSKRAPNQSTTASNETSRGASPARSEQSSSFLGRLFDRSEPSERREPPPAPVATPPRQAEAPRESPREAPRQVEASRTPEPPKEKSVAEASQKSAKGKPPKNEQKSAALKQEPDAADSKPKDQSRPDAAMQQASRSDPPPSVPTPEIARVLTIDNSPAPQPLGSGASRSPAGPPVPPISQ